MTKSMGRLADVSANSLGRQDKEVATALGVSERTVERRVARLMARLETRSRFAAGVQAAKSNWL